MTNWNKIAGWYVLVVAIIGLLINAFLLYSVWDDFIYGGQLLVIALVGLIFLCALSIGIIKGIRWAKILALIILIWVFLFSFLAMFGLFFGLIYIIMNFIGIILISLSLKKK